MKKFALYARVSTGDQRTGLEAQIRALKEHCEITEHELFTDENVSGAKASRPSLDRMMEGVRNGFSKYKELGGIRWERIGQKFF